MATKKKTTPSPSAAALANMYRGMGSSQPATPTLKPGDPGFAGITSILSGTIPGLEPYEDFTAAMPSNADMAVAEDAYTQARADLKLPAEPGKVINAFDEIGAQLTQWNLGTLADVYIQLMAQGYTPSEAMNKLKYDSTTNPATNRPWNAEYNIRFAGNQARIKQGLNAYDESAYLTLENSYADTLRRNNLGNLLSTDSRQNSAKFAGYMEKGLSATEFAARIDEYSERVTSMDPNIKSQFKAFFPGITDSDIVAYLAEPENTLPVLKNKITAAEISASALRVGLNATDKNMALGLAQSGFTGAQAQAGYEKIGDYLERTQFLSNVYDEAGIQYNQTTAEQEELQGLASAKRKREQLRNIETASFSGESGRLRTGQAQKNTGQF